LAASSGLIRPLNSSGKKKKKRTVNSKGSKLKRQTFERQMLELETDGSDLSMRLKGVEIKCGFVRLFFLIFRKSVWPHGQNIRKMLNFNQRIESNMVVHPRGEKSNHPHAQDGHRGVVFYLKSTMCM